MHIGLFTSITEVENIKRLYGIFVLYVREFSAWMLIIYRPTVSVYSFLLFLLSGAYVPYEWMFRMFNNNNNIEIVQYELIDNSFVPLEYISQTVIPNDQTSVLLLYVTVFAFDEMLSSVSGAIHLNGSDTFKQRQTFTTHAKQLYFP